MSHMPTDWFVDHSQETDLWICGRDTEYPDERTMIAEIHGIITGIEEVDRKLRRDIARLIASAPDLLEACRKMAACLRKYGSAIDDLFGDDEDFDLDSMEVAVAKATGGTP